MNVQKQRLVPQFIRTNAAAGRFLEDPLRPHWVCYQALTAAGRDGRACLQAALAELQRLQVALATTEWAESFAHAVPHHRALLQAAQNERLIASAAGAQPAG